MKRYFRGNLFSEKCRTFVLSGGGALGMLQVGALRALLEAGIQPDMWVGTSVGAVNATFLAIHGFTTAGIAALEAAWDDAAQADLLPSSYLWLTARILFNRAGIKPHHHRMREFFMAHGVAPNLHFGDLNSPPLRLVTTNLTDYRPLVYGADPHQSVLEGLLASSAIPPWIRPLQMGDKLLTDGGVVSNVPIEPAINNGATEIVALQLFAIHRLDPEITGFGPFFTRLIETVYQREFELELEFAAAKNIPVRLIALKTNPPYPFWDFANAKPLLEKGYHIAKTEISHWELPQPSVWARVRAWLSATFRRPEGER